MLSLYQPGNNLAGANIAKWTGATFATINLRVNDSSPSPIGGTPINAIPRIKLIDAGSIDSPRISFRSLASDRTRYIFCKKYFDSRFFFFFRLQGRVSVRVAVAAEILLGQGYRRLYRLADEHVFRLWLRVSWKHWTIGDYTAHRSVRWLKKVVLRGLSSFSFVRVFIIKREGKEDWTMIVFGRVSIRLENEQQRRVFSFLDTWINV